MPDVRDLGQVSPDAVHAHNLLNDLKMTSSSPTAAAAAGAATSAGHRTPPLAVQPNTPSSSGGAVQYHLSFENPNYTELQQHARLDDLINSNVVATDEDTPMDEEQQVPAVVGKKRSTYATMDISAMGVDVDSGPTTSLDNKLAEEKLQRRLKHAADSPGAADKGEIESAKLEESSKEKADKSDAEEASEDDDEEDEEDDECQHLPQPRRIEQRGNREAAAAGAALREDSGKQQQQQQKKKRRNKGAPEQQQCSAPSSNAAAAAASEASEVVVVRRRQKKSSSRAAPARKATVPGELPSGWERHEDEEGPYYWHVQSGHIQREIPVSSESPLEAQTREVVRDVRSSRILEDDFDPLQLVQVTSPTAMRDPNSSTHGMAKSCTASSLAEFAKPSALPLSSEKRDSPAADWKRRSMPLAGSKDSSAGSASNSEENKAIQVQVRSLGSVELREDELTPENSSKAVNRCIVQLTSETVGGQGPALGQWGEGKELTLELGGGSLKLIQPSNGLTLHSQPIHSIRVWGVGRDNSQDFAYVAKDKHTRKNLCRVFRCEVPARAIANALRDICTKIFIERSLAQSSSRLIGLSGTGGSAGSGGKHHAEDSLSSSTSSTSSTKSMGSTGSGAGVGSGAGSGSGSAAPTAKRADRLLRPTSLGTHFNAKLQTKTVPAPESFPTPMEEPRKVMKASFLGTLQVNKPCGMDVINEAIDALMDRVPKAQWRPVQVGVAPSTVTITYTDDPAAPPTDCRVRFLSFLGIGENSQQCAFIMHTAQDTFVAHVFHCEPSAGPLCKTIEAACKLRYQKCLDARPQRQVLADAQAAAQGQNGARSLSSTLKNMFGSWSVKGKGGGLVTSPPPS